LGGQGIFQTNSEYDSAIRRATNTQGLNTVRRWRILSLSRCGTECQYDSGEPRDLPESIVELSYHI
jgi:hypothetical protein